MAYVEQSQRLIRLLAEKHKNKEGVIARKLRVTLSTFQNLKRGRLKTISIDLWESINNAVADELRSEITYLERHIEMVDKNLSRIGGGQMAAMAAQLEAMKKLLKERT